jgi:DNA mismatch endonuclease (patch repair protein)
MSRIREKNTAPELSLRRELHRLGFRYRLYGASLPGKPDLILRKYSVVIFVHGCFWRSHERCARRFYIKEQHFVLTAEIRAERDRKRKGLPTLGMPRLARVHRMGVRTHRW